MDANKGFSNLPPFSCADVPLTDRRNKWLTWKRGFEICLRAAKIKDSAEKKDLLLAQGGFELQEIFFSIPGADVEQDTAKGIDAYAVAIQKLDDYFAPQRHEAHERFIFWAMKPEPDETLAKFLMRAQVHAAKCTFGKTSVESYGIAVIDKMLQFVPSQLREKLLQNSVLTVEEVTKQVNAYEATRSASLHIGTQGSSSAIQNPEIVQQVQSLCSRCALEHFPNSQCPAFNKTCSYCKRRGHFRAACLFLPENKHLRPPQGVAQPRFLATGANVAASSSAPAGGKRSFQNAFRPNVANVVNERSWKKPKTSGSTARRVHAINEATDGRDTVELVEMVSSTTDTDDLIWARVGDVLIEMQIDSGVHSNIIDSQTWSIMKRHGVSTVGESRKPDRQFKAYAQKDCLNVTEMFEAEICVNDGTMELKDVARFYVVQDGPQPLLGKETAKRLGVLVVGLPSQQELVGKVHSTRPFPCIKGLEVHIPVDPSVQPVAQRLRRLPFATLDRVEEKLKELLANDIIEPVSEPSRWVSPIVVVIKDTGDIRLCVDMRQVNKAVLRETHPLPTIEDIRWKLHGAKYFSRLDIKDAFHQLALDDESKALTTFITHKGLYRYKRMLFGISSASEVFQKELEQILSDCCNSVNFIDDIIVFGKTEEEHDNALRQVLQKLREFDILLNQSKCAFKLTEIDFLGHHFNASGMTPSQSKVEAIQKFRAPANTEEVRSFLGLVNYVGAFIPDLATVSFPLRELIKSKNVFKWESEQQQAFEKLINLIGQVHALSHFDPKLKTRVVADASPVGLGAVLLQLKQGEPKVVSYASKSLTDTERRYAQTEKEALALVWAVEKFQIYLLGIHFELETDHKPLEAIFSPDSTPCLRIERWVLRLLPFSYTVVYRKGKSNIADPLSRLTKHSDHETFDPDSDVYVRNVVELTAIDIDEVEAVSMNDEELNELRECLDRGIWNYASTGIKAYFPFRNELGKVGDMVVRGSRLVIPKGLRQRMLQLAHEGHPGRTKMAERLRSTSWWPGMDQEIARTVDSCEGCRLVSSPERPEPMQRRKLPDAPWVDVAIDFLGPLPSGDYLLVIIDYFSRYKEVEIMKRITSADTADRLERIFVRLGYPVTVTLDNGRQFVSREFENYCALRGITLNKTTPYWPQENGLVERQNRSLVKRLKISQALKRDWKKDLLTYLSMYYSTPHTTTGKTPSQLMFGREIRTKLPSLQQLGTAVASTSYRDRDQQLKEKGKDWEDCRRKAKPSELKVGDRVLMKNVLPGNKLAPTFNPTIMEVQAKSGPRVTVQDTQTGKRFDRNSSHLKKVILDNNTDGEDPQMDVQEQIDEGLVDATELQQTNSGEAVEAETSSCSAEQPRDREFPRSRPQRAVKMPDRFSDCYLNY